MGVLYQEMPKHLSMGQTVSESGYIRYNSSCLDAFIYDLKEDMVMFGLVSHLRLNSFTQVIMCITLFTKYISFRSVALESRLRAGECIN